MSSNSGKGAECFTEISAYERKINTEEWKSLTDSQYRDYEKNDYNATYKIADLCRILNFDVYRLYTIVRMVRRWEKTRHWEERFPFDKKMSQRILDYIAK